MASGFRQSPSPAPGFAQPALKRRSRPEGGFVQMAE